MNKIILLAVCSLFFSITVRSAKSESKSAGSEWTIGEVASRIPGSVVFASNPDGQYDLFELSDGKIHTLLHSRGDQTYPRVSPDGRYIAYQKMTRMQWDVFLYDTIRGQERVLVADRGNEESVGWFPDSRRVVYDSEVTGKRRIYEVFIESSEVKQITPDTTHHRILASPSPDGRTLAFTTDEWRRWSVGLLDLASGKKTLIVEGKSCRPAWSPDGKKIAVVYSGWNGKGDIGIFDLKTSKLTNATPGRTEFHDYDPRWSPDGKWIAFQSTEDKKHGNWEILVLEVGTGKAYPLISGPAQDVYPDWRDTRK